MIEIIHSGTCPICSRARSQISWQGTDPHEIPEFAKFAIPLLHCCGFPFRAALIQMQSNGHIISERLLEAA
jgi:hypothetical protein